MTVYSHSKLSTFEQCPLKFKFRYIDNLEPDIKQTIEGFLGSMVHEVLEIIYRRVINGETITLDEVIQSYATLWNKSFSNEIKIVKDGFHSEDYFNKGIRFLINYYKKYEPFKDNTIDLERKIWVNLDTQYKIIGYIDRLVHNKDEDIIEIHDYKTSGTLKSQEELDNDRQLALYSMGIYESFPDIKDVHLVWHFLDFDKTLVSNRSKQQLDALRQEIILLIRKIEDTKEFPPVPSCLCNWCEFQNYCPQRQKDFISCKVDPSEPIIDTEKILKDVQKRLF